MTFASGHARFITLLGGAAAAWPLVARSCQIITDGASRRVRVRNTAVRSELAKAFPLDRARATLTNGTLEISNNAAERWRQKSRSSRQLSS